MIRRGDFDSVAVMVWSGTILFQLMTHPYFASLTSKGIADAKRHTEMAIMLTVDSRKEMDTVVETAASSGGKADFRPPAERAGIYSRTFEDPDGHMFEVVFDGR